MNCKAYRDMLHGYANNELNEIERSIVSEHLKSCPSCSDELEEIKKLKLVLGSLKLQNVQLDGIKDSIMSMIEISRIKASTYNVKVLARLGTSMIACGLIALVLNFTILGDALAQQIRPISQAVNNTVGKIDQPLAFINKGMTDMSDFIFDVNGMMFDIEQKIKGGK
jgi:predicted anti-sigma-YlaC factor YlaD